MAAPDDDYSPLLELCSLDILLLLSSPLLLSPSDEDWLPEEDDELEFCELEPLELSESELSLAAS